MSPLMQRALEDKAARRARLMALPYPEKVRIVEQMRAATRQIKTTMMKTENPGFVTKVMEDRAGYHGTKDKGTQQSG